MMTMHDDNNDNEADDNDLATAGWDVSTTFIFKT